MTELEQLAIQQASAIQALALKEDEIQNTSKFASNYRMLLLKRETLKDFLFVLSQRALKITFSHLNTSKDHGN